MCCVSMSYVLGPVSMLTVASALVGAVLQTAAQNIAMLFVGRVIGGIASGIVFGVCRE
jgi:predicted MFS family arabinose efflux permease